MYVFFLSRISFADCGCDRYVANTEVLCDRLLLGSYVPPLPPTYELPNVALNHLYSAAVISANFQHNPRAQSSLGSRCDVRVIKSSDFA